METKLDYGIKIHSEKNWKKLISILFRFFISAAILFFVVSLVTWKDVLSAYRTADNRFIVLGGFCVFANLGIRTLKWRLMLHTVKNAPSFWESFGSVMFGVSLGSLTPGEIGELAGRALHISDAKKSHLLGLALLDKTQIFLVTAATGVSSLAILFIKEASVAALISVGILFFSVVFFLRMDKAARFGHRLNASLFQRSWLTNILDGFSLLQSNQRWTALLLTICFHGIIVLQMFFFVHAFCGITLFQAFVGTSAMMFVKSCIPISLGDLGIREAGTIFFFSLFGVSQAASLNASLLLFVTNVFLPSLCGTFFFKDTFATAWSLAKNLFSNPGKQPHD